MLYERMDRKYIVKRVICLQFIKMGVVYAGVIRITVSNYGEILNNLYFV